MKSEIYIAISLQDYQLKLLTKYKDEHSLTREDAKAEGCSFRPGETDSRCQAFSNLWTKINGEESWSENPWVWVVEFKRVKP